MVNKTAASAKLYLLVFVMSIFIIGIGVYGIIKMKTMNRYTQTLYADRILPVEQLTTIRYSYLTGIIGSAEQVQTHHITYKEGVAQIQHAEKTITDNWGAYVVTYLTPEEARFASRATELMRQSAVVIKNLEGILKKEDDHALDNIINNEVYPAVNPLIAQMNELTNLQATVSADVYKSSTAVYNKALKQFIVLIALSLVFALPFSYYLVRKVKDLITHLNESNEKIARSEQKYRAIFENAQDVFYQTSLDGIIMEASPSCKTHVGFTPEEMIGKSSINLYHNPADRDIALALLKEKNKVTGYEFRFKSNNGEPMYISLDARLIMDANGRPSHIDGVFRNITERRRMEEELIEHKKQLALFIEHSPASLAMFDNGMRYIATSQRWLQDYQLGEQQLIGKIHYEVFPEITQEWKDIHQCCLQGAVEKNEDDSFVRKNGMKESLRWEIHPWFKGNGAIGGIIMFTEVITERKRVTELFKRQFENSPDVIVIINRDFKIESINRGVPGGRSVEELIGADSIDILPAESREAARNAVIKCFETGENQHVEGALRFGNWASSRFVPISYNDGAITHIMVISTDITPRKRAEEKIVQSEARLKEAQAIAHMGNWEIDMVNNVHLWSDELYKILGVNKEEVQPSTELLVSFIHADDVDVARAQISEALTTLRGAAANFRLMRKDRTTVYARIEWRFEFDNNQQPTRLYGILQDITERRKAQESIRQSEANYRHMFNLSPAPMLLFDEESFRFLQVNQACVNHYGYSAIEFAGMTINDIIPEKDEKDLKKMAGKTSLSGPDLMGGGRHVKKSGETMDVITSSIPVVLNGKKQILLVAIDVTERNRYEQKLTRAAIKAQEDERYEIGGELHDNVCQILATSLITLGMMKRKLPVASKQYFEQTHGYISLASQEIRNLSHRLAPTFFEEATLEDVFESLLSGFNVEKKYDISLDFDDAAKRWPLSRELQLNLYRILQEQLSNIHKYASASAIEITVAISNNTLQMQVADDGVGFEIENIKGAGIGLANMNRRARLFSGNFAVDAAIGKGCKILVAIPLSNSN